MWNPGVYRQFQTERDRPFFDLTGQLPADFSPARVTDLGCGTAHQTATLARRWPAAEVTGVDSSAEMLSQAPALDNLRLVQADFRSWTPDKAPDLLLSNAALHWAPDHARLIPRLAATVAPGGVFAFQVPGNFDSPSHLLLSALRREARWRERLAGGDPEPESLKPLDYADLLAPHGFRVNAWETTYLHLLPGEHAVLDWVSGTALRPVLARLSAEEQAEFVAEYGARLRGAYPAGLTYTAFPFRRVFVVAQRVQAGD